jgi:hypothetical protein
MNLKIKNLMEVPPKNHDLPWLQNSLQAAIELELSTLPPYLCGLYALHDQSSDAADLIQEIVLDEMSHFGLACNLLRATAVQPKIFDGYDCIVYPGPLPGGVRPRPDPTLRFPCDPNFNVVLGFTDYQAFIRMCMQIEYPEDPVPRPAALLEAEEVETFPTIGNFYDAVLNSFNDLNGKVPYPTDKQLTKSFPSVFKIDGLTAATRAITQIQKQGEGAAKFPFADPAGKKLAHFYSFGQIYFGKKYVFDPATQTGDWNGDKVDVPPAYAMTPVPLGGYPAGAPMEVRNCDTIFNQMLRQLDQAWAGGGDLALKAAIDSMRALRSAAIDLLQKQIPRAGGGIFGPQFQKSVA